MGGPGSGRQGWWNKRTTVEQCLTLDANQLMRDGMLASGVCLSGILTWSNTRTGERVSSIGYMVNTVAGQPWMRLIYTAQDDQQDLNYQVSLQTTRPYYGGLRWWLTCPIVNDRRQCNRRVAKLHLPPGGKHFGCRQCFDLTYVSCQDSHKYDRIRNMIAMDMGVSPKTVKDLMRVRYPHM